MLTIPHAARLLAQATDAPSLGAIARCCGFPDAAAPLDAGARTALGIPAPIRVAEVIAGRGALRALCLEVPKGACDRETISRVTLRVQRRAPFALWLVIAAERRGNAVAIATSQRAPREQTSLLLADRQRVADSDAETLRALAAAAEGNDVLVHLRWHEILGRDALTRRFFRALETGVATLAESIAHTVPAADARTLAILTSTRLLFLAFLEARGWLDGDHAFLRRAWDGCVASGGEFHRRVLEPLCFGTLNTPRSRRAAAARALGRIPFLNGGLFTRAPLERLYRRARFSDAALGTVASDLLGKWRFTAHEHDTTLEEAAVDPEMLGRAFECLMASRERRSSGAFYTPRTLVAHVFDAALDSALDGIVPAETLAGLRTSESSAPAAGTRINDRLAGPLASLTVLDPACGSGAFLVHALETLASLRQRAGDPRDAGALRRDVLSRQLFGVDREPIAVWLCELRLWLAVVVASPATDPDDVSPLPNLDAQVRTGDALTGDAFAAVASGRKHPLTALRERYARATGARKRTAARALARGERQAALVALDARLELLRAQRRDIVSALRARDLFGGRGLAAPGAAVRLDQLRQLSRETRSARRALARGGAVAFDFAAQFADIGARGGFDVVIGNPPWVRLHRIPSADRDRLRARFSVYRDAGWRAGSELAGAGSGFAAQVDLAALFVERSLSLSRDGGTIALLVPAKLWRSLAGGGVRRLLRSTAAVRELEDWSEARATFDAAVYPSLVVATRGSVSSDAAVRVAEHHRDRALRWSVARGALPFDDTPGAPWLWLPRDPRGGFELLRERGRPLAANDALRPRLGVKCGCNEAFILGSDDRVEAAVARPLLRGEHVRAWRLPALDARLLFPHDDSLAPLRELPPLARRHLAPFRSRLVGRSDLRGSLPWWSLFRLDAARAGSARVVWADLTRALRAAVLPAGDLTVPLNSCYVVRTTSHDEACALAALLNSPVASAWLAALAEPARGGFRRMLGWTVGLLPLPHEWERAVARLAPIGRAARDDGGPAQDELLDAVLDAFGVAHTDVAALLTWGHR